MNKPKIVLPEGNDDRVRIAARILIEKQSAHPVLIGDVDAIADALGKSEDYTVIAPDNEEMLRIQKEAEAKNKTFEVDGALVQGAALVRDGKADGIVAGAANYTSNVLRAYIKVIGMKEGMSRVTSCFHMQKGEQQYLFADCAVNPAPTPEMRAETAHLCAEFAPLVGIKPKVAFLSFASYDSAEHPLVDEVKESLRIAKERWPNMVVDGPLQVDAAIEPMVAKLKVPESSLKGAANVFIFPGLDSGNITYKFVQHLGHFKATGPLLLGFAKPAHDLSRGCSADDVVSAVEVACLQV